MQKYYNTRNRPLSDQSALVQKAPANRRNEVLNAIDDRFKSDDLEKMEKNGVGWLPFVWRADKKVLLFMVWVDEPDGGYSEVSVVPYGINFKFAKCIRPSMNGMLNIRGRCCNHGLVQPATRR